MQLNMPTEPSILCLLSTLLLLVIDAQNCKWNKVDLSPLAFSEISCVWGGFWEIIYTPCGDRVSCKDNAHMAGQYNTRSNSCETILASWDNSVSPKHSTYNGMDRWTFSYSNGETSWGCDQGRWLDLEYICDPSEKANPFDGDKTDCGEEHPEHDDCHYFVRIYSNIACVSDTQSAALSGGWIFVILVIALLSGYCLFGYLWNAYYNKDWNVRHNLPNVAFWYALPRLVIVGCIVTKQSLFGFAGKDNVETKEVFKL